MVDGGTGKKERGGQVGREDVWRKERGSKPDTHTTAHRVFFFGVSVERTRSKRFYFVRRNERARGAEAFMLSLLPLVWFRHFVVNVPINPSNRSAVCWVSTWRIRANASA